MTSAFYIRISHITNWNQWWGSWSTFFNDGDKEFTRINRYGAIRTNSREKHVLSFNKTSLKLATTFLLVSSYFTLGSICFRQLIGTPIESDPTPFIRKLFFYHYENKKLLQTKKQDLQKVHMFSNIFRFIGDPCTFNNDKFGNNYNDIYTDEVGLKKENEDP